jgi:hypothetical protein
MIPKDQTAATLRQTEAHIKKHHAGKGAMASPGPSTDPARAAAVAQVSAAAERALGRKR